jgi:hypothetical protein
MAVSDDGERTSRQYDAMAAGFVIERLDEPQPLPELAEHDPARYERLRTTPRYLFFRLRPTPAVGGRP